MQRTLGVVILATSGGLGVWAQAIHGRDGITLPPPPEVEKIPVTDDYFGTKIIDNYRWLEDGKSTETRAFIDAENAYTARYMKQAHIRADVADDLDPLENVSEAEVPIARGDSYFFRKRLAGEQQFSIYLRHGLAAPGQVNKDERLIDPAKLSRDPNTSLRLNDVSRDGSMVAYGVQEGGADETTIHIFNVKSAKTLEDELPSARYFSVNFSPDGKTLYYTRNDQKGTLLFEHVLGTRNSRDTLLFGHEFYGELLTGDDLFSTVVTDDGHYLVIQIDRGVPAKRVDIVYRDLTKPGSPFEVLVWGLDARFNAIYVKSAGAKGAWYVKTDYKAPKGAILRADPGIMPDDWKTIVPEGQDVIDGWSIVGGKIYVNRLKDVKTETTVYTLLGKPAGKMEYDGIGSASVMQGLTTDRNGFFRFESFIAPPAIYRVDTVTGKREVFFQTRTPFDSSQYELTQVFFKSKDGTRVPMFIAGKKGLKRDGTERLLMTGYGGFQVNYTPEWDPAYAWWLEQGGWFALPNLRGGAEYGESWHQQGMFEKKQNVFDDFFAAAEYLIANKYTSPDHFAIDGTSNGGLLMGAAITQHPELFAAVRCGYPLMDMLRFQKFLVGSYWVTEYGSSDNEKQFPYILKYSPYQNVKAGTAYPAVIFFTGDSDTRVAPLHARKMTALLQASSSSGRPILLHYSLAGGHSGGMGVDQQVQEDADWLTFLWTETRQARAGK
ncbi:MAG: prolyl oligopeptidase family serine peptidase [Terracidiphilus sp.]